jgi:hypothetical protein
MLEVGTRTGAVFANWTDAAIEGIGELDFDDDPLDPRYVWRIKREPIGQDGDAHPVPGVVTSKTSVVLRTDNVVVEALLGRADALDPYAAALQALDLQAREADIESREADTAWRAAETRRTSDALNLVAGLAGGERLDAWERLFPDRPEIEVVPVAAVGNGQD